MKNHTFKKMALCLGLALSALGAKAQTGSSCSSAVPILNGSDCRSASTTNADYWFSFVADDSHIQIRARNANSITQAHVERLEVYSGSCSSLTAFSAKNINPSDSTVTIDTTGFVVGTTYYVKAHNFQPMSCNGCKSNFDLCKMPGGAGADFMAFGSNIVFQDCGLDYTMSSVILNKRNPNGPNGPGQNQPAQVQVSNLPTGAQVLAAYLYFVTIGNTPSTFPVTITDGSNNSISPFAFITGNGVGQSQISATCWQFNGGYAKVTTGYKVDVTTAVDSNGTYTISGLPTNISAPSPNATDVDGATLLVIYKNRCEPLSTHRGTLVLRDGLSMVFAGNGNTLNFNLTSYITNINSKAITAIGDVEANVQGNQTFFDGQAAPYLFWTDLQHNISLPSQANFKALTHSRTGTDCTAIPFMGIFYRDDSATCAPSLNVNAGPNQMICGQNLGYHIQGTCIATYPPVSYAWTPTQYLDSVNILHPTTTTPNDITYTIVATDSIGCHDYDTVKIFMRPLPSATIVGPQYNDCTSGIQHYDTPQQPGIVYLWMGVNGANSHVFSSTGADVDWSTNGGWIYLLATDTVTDCQKLDSLQVTPCCTQPTTVVFNNRTASSILLDPTYANYITGTSLHYTGTIVINGQFIIDTTFRFDNCTNINMGGNAQIQIQPGKTLTFDHSITDVKCGFMWDGIYIQGATAKLNVVNQSKLAQAKNAIVSVSGGDFLVENSTLDNNYKDIVINDYNQVHTGIVRNTTFTMSGTFFPAIPALPLGHNITVCGIEIQNNAGVTIGDASLLSYQNDFTNIAVGVCSRNSITTVKNCRFLNFQPTLSQALTIADAGTCVVSIGKKSYSYFPTINVGGSSSLDRCIMTNVRNGIRTKASQHVNVINNSITKVKLNAIWVESNRSSAVTITDNYISNQAVTYGMQSGIWIKDVPYCNVSITRNSLFQSTNTGAQNGTGIKVVQVSPGTTVVNIHKNSTVTRFRTGIEVINLSGVGNTKIDSNAVSFAKPNSAYTSGHYGIRISGCHDVVCDDNTVTKTGANPVSTMIQNLRGISIENSINTIASDNILIRMGSGLFGYEISSSSTLACNTMNSCFHGVYLTGSINTSGWCDLGDQIVDPNGNAANTGNTWINNVGPLSITGGFISTTLWWYDNNGMPPNSVTNINPQFNGNYACGLYFLVPEQEAYRDKLVGAALRTANDSSTSAEARYTLYTSAYVYLSQNPAWLSLGSDEDIMYQEFYANFDATNIGFITDLIAAADTGNVQFVASGANGMTTTNGIEDNIKKVFTVYAASWMQDVDDFSTVDSLQLYDIATQDPAGGGNGVYGARVLLGLDVDDYGIEVERMGATEAEEQVQPIQFEVYPVPTSDNLSLEFGIDEGQKAETQIFDLTGKLVLVQNLQPLGNVYTIETQTLTEGVYMLRVVVDGHISESKRIVIIK